VSKDYGDHCPRSAIRSSNIYHIGETYRFDRWISSILVVFSIDLTRTLVLGVMGELASFRGLKLRMVFRMRAEVPGLVRTRTESVLRVASTRRPSLLQTWSALQRRHPESSGMILTCCYLARSRASGREGLSPRLPVDAGLITGDSAVLLIVTHQDRIACCPSHSMPSAPVPLVVQT
jgi:hypothetical protein